MDSNRGNITTAFEMLLEQVELEIKHVNKAGARAFESGQYQQVDQARQRGTELREFRERVISLRKEWERLAVPRRIRQEVSNSGKERRIKATRRYLGRAESGHNTPHTMFYKPILQELERLGGSSSASKVLDLVEQSMRETLRDGDYTTVPSDPNRPRWKSSAYYARYVMVREGLLREDSSPGIWEITEQGRQYLAQEMS